MAVTRQATKTTGKAGFRILADALAQICGFRPVEWTEDDKKDWNQRAKENGDNRNQCIMNNTSLRQQASFSESDIKFILSTEKRVEQDCAAHEMELATLVYTLQSLL